MELGRRVSALARELPRGPRLLLSEHVHSAGERDLLLLLHQDRARAWPVEEICDVLRCPSSWAGERLGHLCRAGLLVERDRGYTCEPATPELGEALHVLDEVRRTRWAELAELMASPRRSRRRALAADRTPRG